MSREEILAAIQECAGELKRRPTRTDLERLKGVSRRTIERVFGLWSLALRAAGLEPGGSGYRLEPADLLLDWAAVARSLGALPSSCVYVQRGRHAFRPFRSRFGKWSAVPGEFVRFARKQAIESEWQDVLAMIEKGDGLPIPGRTREGGQRRHDRPVYGPPLLCPGLAHEPANESGVIYLFGVLAERLGFRMLRMQTDFPDCEALREVRRGHWQRVRIEFEFASRNFKNHKHREQDCDMIVCWVHDWPGCPKELEVLELRKIARGL
jgi:hypothetical protein